MSDNQIALIHLLFSEAGDIDLPLWLSGGWAIDAKIGRITREHDDIDIAYPSDRNNQFKTLLKNLGGTITEQTSYGFLANLRGTTLDCEPCSLDQGHYEIDGPPAGSCPNGKLGTLGDMPIRCVSWEALLWDYFHYIEEIPQHQWRPKDFSSFELAKAQYGLSETEKLHKQFKMRYTT